ncbi:MAG TPA: EAL domain-containing protein [Acidiferrobacteraceae bacterium]|nr:EAL domain-containing protein [Acidiferrobacteraceae bacterium]
MDKTLLHLLIVGELAEDGEMLAHIFRESRFLLKTQRIADRASLTAALNKGGWDAVVSRNNVSHLRPETLIDILEKAEQDLPCIVLSDRVEPADVVRLLERGVHDIVPTSQPERLPAIMGRELAAAQARAHCRANARAYQEMESKLGALSATVRDAFCYSQDGMHIETNQAYRELFGYPSADALEGVPILNLVTPSDQGRIKEYFRRAAKGEVAAQEFGGVRQDGSVFAAEMQIHNLQVRGEACQQIVVHERTAAVATPAPAAAQNDGRQRVLEAMATATPATALLYFDVDDLAAFNVTRGNSAGDTALKGLEHVLSSVKDAVCGRVGGDEYAVLTPVPEAQARTLIKAISTRATAEHGISVSASLSFREPGETDIAWLERAHRLLAPPLAPESTEIRAGADTEAPLRMDPAQIVVLYQPIVPLHGEAVEHYEVTVQHNGRIIRDTARLPLEIDTLVLEQALKTAQRLHKAGHPVRLLMRPGLAFMERRDHRFAQDLGTLPPGILGFSVNEGLLEQHAEPLVAFIRSVRRQELKVALDAAGTGASSGHLLGQRLFDFVELDSGLATNLAPDSLNYLLVTQAVALARKCGCQTILRSVDTADAVSALWQCEVDYVEGRYFQEPLPEPNYDFGGEVVSTDVGAGWRSSN